MTFEDFLKNILIVVVLYKKKISECESLLSISNALGDQFIDVLIYDNSPEYNLNQTSIFKNLRLHNTADYNNSGVSKAYNEGAKLAQTLGKKWLIIFDQDTIFEEDALTKYYQSIVKYSYVELFVPILKCKDQIISPCKYYFKNGFLFKKEFYGLTSIRHKSILNSGICISVKAFENVGGYNEKVKLYFSDFNFIDRFRKTYRTFAVVKTSAEHNMLFLDLNSEKSVTFFLNYCIGARSLVNNTLDYLILLVVVFYRLVIFTIKFKRTEFIKIFHKHFILKRA
jgi:GT2 family glycosyltransferase